MQCGIYQSCKNANAKTSYCITSKTWHKLSDDWFDLPLIFFDLFCLNEISIYYILLLEKLFLFFYSV